MGEKVIGGIEPLTATGFDGTTEMQRVPVDESPVKNEQAIDIAW
jgi:hypothetical protein